MAEGTFHTGDHAKVFVGSNELPAGKWTLKIKSNAKDVTNSRDGRKRIPGIADCSGTVDMPYDTANEPTATSLANIRHGSLLTLNLYVDDDHFYGVKAIVEEVDPGSDVNNEVTFNFSFDMEKFWDPTADPPVAILYPAFP